MKTPIYNSTEKSFTRRDTLGLQSISSSIQASICPIINVVTPHPFYWAFLIWNYYHYYTLPENKNKKDSDFNIDFVKRNDFFFVLSNHLAGKNMDGIVGKDNINSRFPDKSINQLFTYDKTYYTSHFGGMQYYNFGCFSMGFVKEDLKIIDLNSETDGALLTKAFDEVIQDTNIYKNYISKNIPLDNVSREDLIELSRYLSINLDGMDKVKNLIYFALFEKTKEGRHSHLYYVEKYLNRLIDNKIISKTDPLNSEKARKILYGNKHPIILEKTEITGSERNMVTLWELVVANQYYVACLEMIWKYLLSILSVQCTQDEWIEKAFKSCSQNLNLNEQLSSFDTELNIDDLESKITNYPDSEAIHSVVEVLMSLYNRFKNRVSDFDVIQTQKEFCVFSLIRKIKNGDFTTVRDLLVYLIKVHIIDRHKEKAMEKQYQGRDGFLYEKIYDKYISRGADYTINVDFPALRIVNVFSVLKDLGKI